VKTLDEVCRQLTSGEFELSCHAFRRAVERNISEQEIREAAADAEVVEDFQELMRTTVPEDRLEFEWHDRERDPDAKYVVDCRINQMKEPIHVFALPNDAHVRDATIVLHALEKWFDRPVRSVGIFENQEEINRKVLARFSDVCEKQYSNLASNRPRIENYFKQAIEG